MFNSRTSRVARLVSNVVIRGIALFMVQAWLPLIAQEIAIRYGQEVPDVDINVIDSWTPRLSHSNYIWGFALSVDRKRLASCGASTITSTNGNVEIHDTDTCQKLMRLVGHVDRVTSMAFSHDDELLATGSDDCTVKIWNARSGQCQLTLKGHSNPIRSVVFTSRGQLASASGCSFAKDLGSEVIVWDAGTGRSVHVLKGHSNAILSVAYNTISEKLATAGRDCTIKLWNLDTGLQLAALKAHDLPVQCVAFRPHSEWLASVAGGDIVKIWDATTGRMLFSMRANVGPLVRVEFSGDGKRLVAAGVNGIVIWDVATRGELLVRRHHSFPIIFAALNLNGKRVLSASEHGTVVWDAVPSPR